MKKLKKICIVIFVILLILKLCEAYIIICTERNIRNFINSDNWYYCNIINKDGNEEKIEEWCEENAIIIKHNNLDVYNYIDYNNSEKYVINTKNKQYYKSQELLFYDKTLYNLPEDLVNIKEMSNILKLRIMLPTFYDGKFAIMLISSNGKTIIDLKMKYPLYEEIYIKNWKVENKETVKYYYKFEKNTDFNDVNLENLNEYTLIE